MSCGACWTEFGAVCWQPTGLMGPVGPSLGCVLAMSYETFWTEFGHVCWEPTSLIGPIKFSAVCWQPAGFTSLAVSWQPTQFSRGMLERVWGLMLATYKSYGAYWAKFGAVCWQPTSLMVPVGPSLVLYAGNLQVLWGLLD